MASLRELEQQGEALRALDSIVTGMKAYAGVTIRKTQNLLPGVQAAGEHLLAAFADLAPLFPELLQARAPGRQRILVAFGSSQGLCGGFNEHLAAAVAAEAVAGDLLVVIGSRLATLLAGRGLPAASVHDAVVSVNAIEPALRAVVARLMADYAGERYYELTAVYAAVEENRALMRVAPLLPPDPAAVAGRRGAPREIVFYLAPRAVLAAALREFLGNGLLRCSLESLRSENWYRLRSLEGASENLGRRLGEIRTQRHYLAQEEVTEEMLEILSTGLFYGGGRRPVSASARPTGAGPGRS